LRNGGTAQELIATIDSAPTSIIFIAGYESKTVEGEVANVFAIKGASYENTISRSLRELDRIEQNSEFSIDVKWKEWANTKTGQITTAACKSKELRSCSITLRHGDEELAQGIAKVRKSLTTPQESHTHYQKEGNGVYGYDGKLYIRDCRILHKVIVQAGEDKIRTSSRAVAIGNAVRSLLAVSKYREFLLDGRYQYIAVGGNVINPEGMRVESEREAVAIEKEAEHILTIAEYEEMLK
jgi:hypothetical protein